MNSKHFIFATLCALLFVQQAAGKAVEEVEQPSPVEEVKQPDELYILNPGSAFPYIVTDPNNPMLNSDSRQVIRICIAKFCQSTCSSLGFRVGRCSNQAVCVCSR